VAPPAPSPDAITVTTAAELQRVVDEAPNGQPTAIRLVTDITLAPDSSLRIPSGKVITLEGSKALIGDGYADTIESDGDLTINGVTVTHSQTEWTEGSGIWARPLSRLTIAAGSVNGNPSGGVFVTGATLDIAGGEIADNIAGWWSGGVYAHGGALSESGYDIPGPRAQVTIRGCARIHDNATKSSAYGYHFGHGVGVSDTDLTMTGGLIYHNGLYYADQGYVGAADGGGLAVTDGATAEISGGVIGAPDPVGDPDQGNIAARGGGIYIGSGARVRITGDARVSGNSALGNESADGMWTHTYRISGGGGVYVDESPVEGSSFEDFLGSTLIMDSGLIADNTAEQGGGIMVDGLVTDGMTDETPPPKRATVDLRGGDVQANHATEGSGVYAGAASRLLISEGVRVHHNSPNEWQARSTSQGGGVYAVEGDVAISGGAITDNRADNGGGLYLSAWKKSEPAGSQVVARPTSVQLRMNDGVVNRNTARQGGGVYLDDADFMMNGGVIGDPDLTVGSTADPSQGNVAGQGGGLYVATNPGVDRTTAATLAGSARVAGNRTVDAELADSHDGGGVWVGGRAKLTMADRSMVVGNASVASGGGIYAHESTVVMGMGNPAVSDNTSGGDGGGIHLTGGSLTSEPADDPSVVAGIVGNRALRYGGGVYAVGADVRVKDRLTSNTADRDGGGAYLRTVTGAVEGRVTDNAAGRDGGGVYLADSSARVSGLVTGNTASRDGGGIFLTVNELARLDVSSTAEFGENSAGSWFDRAAEFDTIYREHIEATRWTAPFTQGYNNDDIGYSDPHYFTVVFIDWDVSELSRQSVLEDGAAVEPPTPTRQDYGFARWSKPFDDVQEELVTQAQYQPLEWAIHYDYDGGVAPTVDNPGEFTFHDLPLAISQEPMRPAYVFVGWAVDSSDPATTIDTIPAGTRRDVTLTAVWRPVTVTPGPMPQVTPVLPTEVTPHPGLSAPPVLPTGVAPHPGLSATPVLPSAVTPGPMPQVTPTLPTVVTPHPGLSATPILPTTVAPHPGLSATPILPSAVTPAPMPQVTPTLPTEVTPHPGLSATPTLPSTVTPHPGLTATPQWPTHLTPVPGDTAVPVITAMPMPSVSLAPTPSGTHPVDPAPPMPTPTGTKGPTASVTPTPTAPTTSTSTPSASVTSKPPASGSVTPTVSISPSESVTASGTAGPTSTAQPTVSCTLPASGCPRADTGGTIGAPGSAGAAVMILVLLGLTAVAVQRLVTRSRRGDIVVSGRPPRSRQ
jgi:uncharacterized repeat protein (TIGR02543 family)